MRSSFFLVFGFLLCQTFVAGACLHAEDTLDTLLPKPKPFLEMANALNVDGATKSKIEMRYQSAKLEYLKLNTRLDSLMRPLFIELIGDTLNSDKIKDQMGKVLDAENDLKIFQVKVRISLLSQISSAQLMQARAIAKAGAKKEEWVTGVLADPTLQTMLPRPSWLRSRAEEIGLSADVRDQLEKTYYREEPKYHELKAKIGPLNRELFQALSSSQLDEPLIVARLSSLLAVERELKLHQVHVRTSLLKHLTSEQRRTARRLAEQKPEVDWRKSLADKVETVRTLSKKLAEQGESVAQVDSELKRIERVVAGGRATEGARRLNKLAEQLQVRLKGTDEK